MLVILPPSESKRDGGDSGAPLDLDSLSFPALRKPRVATLAALRALSRNANGAMQALGIGEKLRFEVERNRTVTTSPTMPAIERYTGVLFDGLDVPSLDGPARRFLGESVAIHSALFGLVLGDDAIPAYRLSHDSKLPRHSLKSIWRSPISKELHARRGIILDLRSKGYVELGPFESGTEVVPGEPGDGAAVDHAWLNVVTAGPAGELRALNHFNKKGKGEFVRALAEHSGDVQSIESIDDLIAWSRGVGLALKRGRPGQLDLVV